MVEIQAAVATEFDQPLTLETLTLRAPRNGEVQVRIEAVAICHSDISYLDGGWGGSLPAVYGHEAAGIIEEAGPGVKLAVGSRVIVTLVRSCGTCAACGAGRPVYCADPGSTGSVITRADGTEVWQGLKCGAFAERVVVDQSQVVPVSNDLPPDLGCLLACGVPTGLGAVVNTAGVRPGQSVVVVGAGGVGLNAIQGAHLAGAARIIAMDLEPSKLDDAVVFGATDGVLVNDPKPWRKVREITGGRGADHVFVTVGAIPAYDVAPRFLAPGGTVYAVGMPHTGALSNYEPVVLAATGQGLRGSLLGEVVLSRDIPWMVDLYMQGRLKLDELVTERWRFDQINDAIASTKAAKARRNVIVF